VYGCAEKFALLFQKDLDVTDLKTENSPGSGAGAKKSGQQGGGKKGRDTAKEAIVIKNISVGLRTAVLAFATDWLLRHCTVRLDGAAGEVTTML
jgi:hypothetical protein